jgi:hypothetical protein
MALPLRCKNAPGATRVQGTLGFLPQHHSHSRFHRDYGGNVTLTAIWIGWPRETERPVLFGTGLQVMDLLCDRASSARFSLWDLPYIR